MTKEEFLEKLKKVLQTNQNLQEDMVLQDMNEWDSLSRLEVQILLEECGKRISYEDVNNFKTVSDILKYVFR